MTKESQQQNESLTTSLPSSFEVANLFSNIELKIQKETWNSIEEHGYFKWVQDNWTSRGEPLDFVKHKYLVDIYKDQHPFIAYMKAAQTGGTERVITEALWLPDQMKENTVYIFPTGGSVGDLVQERVDEPLNQKKYLRLVSGREQSEGKHADHVRLKKMSKGFVYFRGSGSVTQITSIPADMVIADEVDRMPPENVPYIAKRLEHSNRRWQRWLSTPTIQNYGIHKIFLETDQRHYNLKCEHCGKIQILDFWKNVEYTMSTETEIKSARLVCLKCRRTMVPWECEGEWIAQAQSEKHGYHISKLYSPRLSLVSLVESSLKTSSWEVQQFYNQDLGLPYEPKGGSISEKVIHSCSRDYKLPVKGGTNFMGVDVGLKLHIIIQNSKNQISFIGVRDSFEELDELMRDFNVKTCVIDALPETRKVQEFIARFVGRAYMCYYSGLSEPKKNEWFRVDGQKVNTGRTLSLDMYTARFNKQTIQLPKNIDDYVEFKDHMKSLTRIIVEKARGAPVAEYLQKGPDHFYHAGNYSNLAKGIMDKVSVPEIFII